MAIFTTSSGSCTIFSPLRENITIIVNISAASVTVHKDRTSTLTMTLEIVSIDRLARVLAKIEGIKDVFSVTRDGSSGQARAV